MFQRSEERMPKQLVDGIGSREVEDVDEIVPSRIKKDNVLRNVVCLAMEIEKTIHRSDLKISPPERRESRLEFDRMFFGSKGLVSDDCIKAERSDWKDTGRFYLSRYCYRKYRDTQENDKTDILISRLSTQRPDSLEVADWP